jgi:ribosomal protein L21E
LIVEVKHYKKAARARFREVLVDYARAHPEGTILLVNHGPVGDMVDGIDEAIRRRCDMFGNLTPRNVGQRDAFKTIVRKHVGEPICSPEIESAGAGTAVLIDVSGSMASAIAGAGFAGLVGKVTANGVDIVALADNEIRQRCLAADAVAASRGISGHSTELIGPARILLNDYEGVVVITDSDGAADLSALGERLLSRSSTGVDGLWLARLRR